MSSDQQINKSGGHCYDDTRWNTCPFWYHIQGKPHKSWCKLFGGVKGVQKYASESLNCCNKIYGRDYHGEV